MMNWQTILLGILCLFTSGVGQTVFSEIRDFNESQILGVWRQMYSNRFVQETEEVGWRCVSINVSQVNKGSNQLDIYKYAMMNGNKSNLVSHRFRINQIPPTKDQIDGYNDTSIVPIIYMSDEIGQPYYILKDYDEQYNYIIWTKSDNASIYVWTRNVIEFKVNYDWEVLERFISWNYSGYYKFPLASYTFQCMNHRNETDSNR
jgi:hypothetical protein